MSIREDLQEINQRHRDRLNKELLRNTNLFNQGYTANTQNKENNLNK